MLVFLLLNEICVDEKKLVEKIVLVTFDKLCWNCVGHLVKKLSIELCVRREKYFLIVL